MDSSPDPALTPPPFPQTGRLLGIDYGSKRVGLAVCNPEQTIASPVESYVRINPQMDARKLQQIVQEYRIVGLIVGLPVHMSGDEGGKAKEARTFGNWVARETGRPIRYFDERFTSMAAEQHLMMAGLSRKKRQARIDKLAASILLQSYLDSPDRLGEPRPPEDLRAT